MGRAATMKGPLTADGEAVRAASDDYLNLATELDEKRAATKVTTGGKTAWRRRCVERNVDPVILADATELMRKVELDPEKITRDWRVFNGYLRALGFFDQLVPDLLEDFDPT